MTETNEPKCPICGGAMKPRGLFSNERGCLQPRCQNYYRRPK